MPDPITGHLDDYEVKAVAETSWGAWQAATGGLSVAIAVAAGADAALAGAIGVFVTATSRGVLIVGSKLWQWFARKLEGQPPRPPGPTG